MEILRRSIKKLMSKRVPAGVAAFLLSACASTPSFVAKSVPPMNFQGRTDVSVATGVLHSIADLDTNSDDNRLTNILAPTYSVVDVIAPVKNSPKQQPSVQIFNHELASSIKKFREQHPRQSQNNESNAFLFNPNYFGLNSKGPDFKAPANPKLVKVSESLVVQFGYLYATYRRQDGKNYVPQAAIAAKVNDLKNPLKTTFHIIYAQDTSPASTYKNLDEMENHSDEANTTLQNVIRLLAQYAIEEVNKAYLDSENKRSDVNSLSQIKTNICLNRNTGIAGELASALELDKECE